MTKRLKQLVTLISSHALKWGHVLERFDKYTLSGHVYILSNVILEEGKNQYHYIVHTRQKNLEETLSRRDCFPNEISPIKLASSARMCIKKYKNNYKIDSFCNLAEWRCRKLDVDSLTSYVPNQQDIKIIIDECNIFQPNITQLVKWNSEELSEHLKNIICLFNNDNLNENFNDFAKTDRPINNEGNTRADNRAKITGIPEH